MMEDSPVIFDFVGQNESEMDNHEKTMSQEPVLHEIQHKSKNNKNETISSLPCLPPPSLDVVPTGPIVGALSTSLSSRRDSNPDTRYKATAVTCWTIAILLALIMVGGLVLSLQDQNTVPESQLDESQLSVAHR